jgi:DNA-binding beta-propeller fold protein YncE
MATLCSPAGVAIDDETSMLYITDSENNRVVIHSVGEGYSHDQDPVGLIGQETWTDSSCGQDEISAKTLCYPLDIAIDAANDSFYVSDSDFSRVLRFERTNNYTGQTEANLVYGQMSMTGDACNFDGDEYDVYPSEYTLCYPSGVDVNQETGQLWVADSYNHRVLGYGEANGTSGEDLNGDGIPDSAQPNVGGYISPVTGKLVAIDVGEGCELTVDDMTTEAQLGVQDPAYEYANGLWDFEADCGTPGYTTTISLYYYDVSPDGLVLRKHNPLTNAFFTIEDASISTQTINGSSVMVLSYQITDGEERDTDGIVNGMISDPAGPASLVLNAPNTGLGGNR